MNSPLNSRHLNDNHRLDWRTNFYNRNEVRNLEMFRLFDSFLVVCNNLQKKKLVTTDLTITVLGKPLEEKEPYKFRKL